MVNSDLTTGQTVVAFLSGLDFFVHDSRVSFSIRERNPQIVVSVSVFQVLWSKKRRIDSDNFLQDRFVPSTISSYGRRRPTGSSEGHRRGRVRPSDPFAPARSGLSLSAAIFRSGALLVDSRVRVGPHFFRGSTTRVLLSGTLSASRDGMAGGRARART